MRLDRPLAALALLGLLSSARAQIAPANAWFPVPLTAVFLTGDSWTDQNVTFRLYGVQSCIRGTSFTNAHGQKRDCGEAMPALTGGL